MRFSLDFYRVTFERDFNDLVSYCQGPPEVPHPQIQRRDLGILPDAEGWDVEFRAAAVPPDVDVSVRLFEEPRVESVLFFRELESLTAAVRRGEVERVGVAERLGDFQVDELHPGRLQMSLEVLEADVLASEDLLAGVEHDVIESVAATIAFRIDPGGGGFMLELNPLLFVLVLVLVVDPHAGILASRQRIAFQSELHLHDDLLQWLDRSFVHGNSS